MKISEILIMTPDDIDFKSLDADILEALVRANEDQFIATDALRELESRNPSRALALSEDVFRYNIGDKYLRAQAVRIIYLHDRKKTFENFEEKLRDFDSVVLNELIDLFWVDLKEEKDNPDFQSRLVELVAQINSRELKQFESQDYIKDLVAASGL